MLNATLTSSAAEVLSIGLARGFCVSGCSTYATNLSSAVGVLTAKKSNHEITA